MKGRSKYIQLFVFLGLAVFLYSFSKNRNDQRELRDLQIQIVNKQNEFITEEMILKFISLSDSAALSVGKDSLDVNLLENKLNENGLIKRAEVYQTITGNIGLQIEQREPIARVMGKAPFYIDREGATMPLSENYSARVPLVQELDSAGIREVYPLLSYLAADDFLKQLVIGVQQEKGDYILELRQHDFKINIGPVADLDKKFNNFKSFYKKAERDSLFTAYSLVNLKYTNQVVCTKTEV